MEQILQTEVVSPAEAIALIEAQIEVEKIKEKVLDTPPAELPPSLAFVPVPLEARFTKGV